MQGPCLPLHGHSPVLRPLDFICPRGNPNSKDLRGYCFHTCPGAAGKSSHMAKGAPVTPNPVTSGYKPLLNICQSCPLLLCNTWASFHSPSQEKTSFHLTEDISTRGAHLLAFSYHMQSSPSLSRLPFKVVCKNPHLFLWPGCRPRLLLVNGIQPM